MESHNKVSFWTRLEKEACDNNDHCGERKAALEMLEQLCEMILKIVSIYLRRAHAHENKDD
jgi:hypothetical protein